MTLTGGNEIQRVVDKVLVARPYRHAARVDDHVTAIITVQEDTRFLPETLRAVFSQTVVPGAVVIADCSQQETASLRTDIDIMTQSAAAQHQQIRQQVTVQIMHVHHAQSFGDAVGKVTRISPLAQGKNALWLLHDDSRPADQWCLERLLEAWSNTPTAAILGAKQLDWDGELLHNVGAYAGHHCLRTLVVDGEPDQEQYDMRQDVFAVSFAGALVVGDTLEAMRGVTPWFGTFGESADFCRRLCLHGKRVVVVPQARIAHRRARFEGIRTADGQPLDADEAVDTSMTRLHSEQKYRYTDISGVRWPVVWLASILIMCVKAVRELFRKNPYQGWCMFCMPWIALCNIPSALGARRRVRNQSVLSYKDLSVLTADRRQIDQWKQATRQFENQQQGTLLNPLVIAHLRKRRIVRWTIAIIAALVALLGVCAMYWDVLRSLWSGGSLYSTMLAPTGATMGQLVASATTPWVFGVGTGVPAPPTPWLLVLMVASVFTGGHVAAALSLMFFLAAPAMVLSFWALAGVVTRSDTVRACAGLAWFALACAWGLFAQANMPMLTVFVCLPAAFAFVFRAVGMYRTEVAVHSRPSIQAAALAALLFIPVVAAEPQLLFALIVLFIVFLVFVTRHRLMLVLIPFPAAFAIAPTLVNAIRYGYQGMWRQLFGDIMLPAQQVNGAPRLMGIVQIALDLVGLGNAQWTSSAFWKDWSHIAAVAVLVAMVALTLIALGTLLMRSVLRPSRMLWSLIVAGLLLAVISPSVGIAVTPYGQAGGSAAPGMALTFVGVITCAAMVAGPAITHFTELRGKESRVQAHARMGSRIVMAVVLACVAALCATCGVFRAQFMQVGVSSQGIPVVAQDYLAQNGDRRVLAMAAESNGSAAYNVMRTSRGDLIDSSPVQRVRVALNREVNPENDHIALISGKLLGNADSDAINELIGLGFGGIYVVKNSPESSAKANDQLISNITASDGTQTVVNNDEGIYFRLVNIDGVDQKITTDWQQRTQSSVWRQAWLWCLGVIAALYVIVAIPRTLRGNEEEA